MRKKHSRKPQFESTRFALSIESSILSNQSKCLPPRPCQTARSVFATSKNFQDTLVVAPPTVYDCSIAGPTLQSVPSNGTIPFEHDSYCHNRSIHCPPVQSGRGLERPTTFVGPSNTAIGRSPHRLEKYLPNAPKIHNRPFVWQFARAISVVLDQNMEHRQ